MGQLSTEELIRELHRIWNTGDIQAIPNVYAENFVVHWPRGWNMGNLQGIDGITKTIIRSRQTFDQWHEQILDLTVSEDRAVSRYRSTGIHRGDYLGLRDTGNKVDFEEISIFRIDNHLVVEQWCLGDDLTCMAQMKGEII